MFGSTNREAEEAMRKIYMFAGLLLCGLCCLVLICPLIGLPIVFFLVTVAGYCYVKETADSSKRRKERRRRVEESKLDLEEKAKKQKKEMEESIEDLEEDGKEVSVVIDYIKTKFSEEEIKEAFSMCGPIKSIEVEKGIIDNLADPSNPEDRDFKKKATVTYMHSGSLSNILSVIYEHDCNDVRCYTAIAEYYGHGSEGGIIIRKEDGSKFSDDDYNVRSFSEEDDDW